MSPTNLWQERVETHGHSGGGAICPLREELCSLRVSVIQGSVERDATPWAGGDNLDQGVCGI